MTEPASFKYRAFISYSHADTAQAKWLHRALEGFAIDKDLVGRETAPGPIPKALRPIFRDRDDFTAGHTLSEQTLAALDASAGLVLICSPAAAKSHYVNEETRLFKSRHPERPVIPLIAGGKPGDPELECFPSALKFKLDPDGQITGEPVELLAADAREDGDGKSLALSKVVAGLLGVSSDDIFRRAMRERRRKQRNWIAGLSVVAVMLAGLAVWAEINRREAVAQREEAERNFEIAQQGANSLVFDIAQALRDQQGMRTETVRKILGTAEQVIGKLVAKSDGNRDLLHLQSSMLDEFARTYAAQGDTAKQEEMARKELAIAESLVRADPSNAGWQHGLSVAYERVGDVLKAHGNLAEGLKFYRDGLVIRERLAKADPGNVQLQRNLSVLFERVGDVLLTQGNLAEALSSYRDSLAIRERLAEGDPGNAGWQRILAYSYQKVGDVSQAQGNLADALASYRKSLAIRDGLSKSDPGNTEWLRDLSISHEQVGAMLEEQGDLAESLKSFQAEFAIAERLTKADASNADWQRDLSIAYTKIGDIFLAQDKIGEALASYRDSLAVRERLATADPSAAGRQSDLSVAYNRVGDVLQAQGNLDEALVSLRQSLAIRERLASADPSNVDWQRDLAISHGKVGSVLAQQGEAAQALGEYRQGRDIIARLMEQAPDNATLPNDIALFDSEIAKLEQAGTSEPAAGQPEQAAQ
jgi:tetratricopeptide (TPR) repeat protein